MNKHVTRGNAPDDYMKTLQGGEWRGGEGRVGQEKGFVLN